LEYWKKRGLDPNYIYDQAADGWEKVVTYQSLTPSEESMYQL